MDELLLHHQLSSCASLTFRRLDRSVQTNHRRVAISRNEVDPIVVDQIDELGYELAGSGRDGSPWTHNSGAGGDSTAGDEIDRNDRARDRPERAASGTKPVRSRKPAVQYRTAALSLSCPLTFGARMKVTRLPLRCTVSTT